MKAGPQPGSCAASLEKSIPAGGLEKNALLRTSPLLFLDRFTGLGVWSETIPVGSGLIPCGVSRESDTTGGVEK